VKRALAADLATNQLAAREIANHTAEDGSAGTLVCVGSEGGGLKAHRCTQNTNTKGVVWGRGLLL
jgi:hypothetical protein